MLRYLISLLLLPLVQRFATSLIAAVLRNVQARAQGPAQPETGTHYQEDREIFYGRVHRIIDGDSLYVTRHEDQIRLWGVNAPEKHEQGYNDATQALHRLAMDKELEVQVMGRDKYGRTLARCFFKDGRELNFEMIKSGTAKEYMRFTKGYYSER